MQGDHVKNAKMNTRTIRALQRFASESISTPAPIMRRGPR